MLPAYIIDRIRAERESPTREAMPLHVPAELPVEPDDEPEPSTSDHPAIIDFSVWEPTHPR